MAPLVKEIFSVSYVGFALVLSNASKRKAVNSNFLNNVIHTIERNCLEFHWLAIIVTVIAHLV